MADLATQPAIIQLRGIAKRFGSFNAVERVDLDIPTNAFFALLGPSGCGKTTLLRMIAGFETPTSGTIAIDGQPMDGSRPRAGSSSTARTSRACRPTGGRST